MTRGTLTCLRGLTVDVGTEAVSPAVLIQTRPAGELEDWADEAGEDGTTIVTGDATEEVANTCGRTAAIRIDVPNDDARWGDVTTVAN